MVVRVWGGEGDRTGLANGAEELCALIAGGPWGKSAWTIQAVGTRVNMDWSSVKGVVSVTTLFVSRRIFYCAREDFFLQNIGRIARDFGEPGPETTKNVACG